MVPGIQNIIVWGDSVLKGVIQSSSREGYEVLEENAISLAAEKLGLNVVNSSRFGSTITRGKRTLLRDLEKGVPCDVAIIEFGGNDCDFKWQEVSDEPEKVHQPGTPIDVFLAELTNLVKVLRDQGIHPLLTSLPPLVPERYFRFITRNGPNPENLLAWLGDVGYLYRWHEMYSNKIVQLAGFLQCRLLDVRSVFLAQREYWRYLCEDGIHPNALGHRLMESVFEQTALEYAAT